MSNISDYFRDPRLADLDDPQVGVIQLDDLMDPVQPGPGKAPNKMARFFSTVSLTTGNIDKRTIDNILMKPEYWILRIVALATASITIMREGGDDVTIVIPGANPTGANLYGPMIRLIFPGPAGWLQVTNAGAGTIALAYCAMAGYNPLEIF